MKNEYVWASSDRERHRLASQGDALRSPTERLFQSAGIGAGMSVLDCGSGAGDVAIIVAELVTSSGQVLGIDRDANNVEAANRRVIELLCRMSDSKLRIFPARPMGRMTRLLVAWC